MWKDLTLKEKAEIIKMSVANGVTDINDIKAIYDNETHNYQLGGYKQWKNAIAKYKHLDIDNDPTYDYEGFYNSDPVRAWNLLNEDPSVHFVDNFKTAQHPTFSKKSDYSGKFHPIYNPQGIEGGTWGDRSFTLPKDWQKGPSLQDRISYLEDAEDEGVALYGPNGELPVIYSNDVWGGVLPNIDVYKKALGGHLYENAGPLNKKQAPKYKYGLIEQILRENGVNFRVTSGARKPNQAGNAGKGSAHTYTIFGNSPGAIDIVPGVGSDWNTLFTQMNSPKVRSALAAYGLDVLNETNPSVMASTNATGPHLHVGRGIKGQSGTGQMFGGTSFGGGKSDYYAPQYSSRSGNNYMDMVSQSAMEPITLAGSNATSPWLSYISKIGQQRPVSFNTPIGPSNNLVSNNQINIGPVDFSNIGKADELMSFINPYTSKQALEYDLGLENNALWNSPYLLFNEHTAANGGHIYKNGTPKRGMQKLRDFELSYPDINVAPIRKAKNKVKLKIKQLKDKIKQSVNNSTKQVGQILKEDMQVADALTGATLSSVTGNSKYLENSLKRLNRVLGLNRDLEYSEYKPIQLNSNEVILKNAQIASEEDILNQNKEYLKNLNKVQLRKLQEKLYKAGLLEKKNIDGVYGQVTQDAFNKYNNKQGKWNADLSANGIDGCAQWVTLKYENATGASSAQNGVTLNAWEMLKNIENHGGTMLYNIYDDDFNNLSTHEEVNTRTENAVRNNPVDYSTLNIGDVVGIYMPGSDQWEVALKEGTTKNTHVGIITGFDKEGEPIVEHNIHGKKRIDPISNIGGSAKGTPLVTAVARPNYTGTQVKQLHWDPKKSIYTVDEKYNNTQLEEYMNSMAGISDQIQKLYPGVNMEDAQLAALSVLKRETNFMNNKTSDQSTTSQIKEAAGNVVRSLKGMSDETKSSDLSKLKLSTLSSAEKQLLGIYSKDDLENPTKAGAAALMIMARNMDYFNRLSQQYPDLGITSDDIYNATVLSYNQGMDKLMSLGFNEKGIAPEELEQLRELSNPSSKIKDVNSSKYKYLGAIGEYLYDELEDPYTPYIAAANDAASKYIKKNGEYIPVRADVNPSNVDYVNRLNNNNLQDILNPQFVSIATPTLQELALPNFNTKALGGHLFDNAGQMLIRDNAVNPLYQYVYGPEYEEIIRQRRNWRPSGRTNVQRSKPKYDIEARGDVTTNTVRPTQRVIRRKQTSESPARRAKEQQRYDAMMTQYRNERQGTISQAPNRLRHPDYDPVKANQVQQRYEQNEIAEQKAHNRRVLEHNILEGMEAIPWPSTIAGAYYNPNTHWYDPFSFFSNLYANDNRGFFNYNQATRDFYDANPEVGSVANLIGDFVVPGAAAKVLKGASRLGKFAAADIGDAWKTMRYELAHPEAQTLGIIPDRLNPFISERKYYNKVQKLNELEHPLMYKTYRVNAGNYNGRLTLASGKPTSDITGVDSISYDTPIMNFPGGDPKDILKWHEEIPLQNGLVLDFDPATVYDYSPFLPLDNKYNIISNVGNDQELVVKNILGTTTERFSRNPVTMSGNQSGLIPMNTKFSYPSFRDIEIKVDPKTGETNIGTTPPIGFSAKQSSWYPVYPEITGGQPIILPETHPIRRAATQYVTDLERRLATDSGIPLATVEGSYRAVMNGLPHTPKDVEFLLPESNLKKLEELFNVRSMKPKGNGFGYTVEAEEFDHLFGNVNGKVADFEVLKNGPNGGAIGNTAWEIYQYLHPEEASKLAEKYMDSVASNIRSMTAESYKEGMELPISAEQLYKEYVESGLYKDKYLYDTMVAMPDNDPTKHMFRRNDLELGSDPSVMLPKLADRVHREIPGAKTLKEQGFNIDYTNVEANKKFLDYWGLPQEFATDPERMEIIVEQQIHAYQMAKRGTNVAIPGQSGESWVRKPLSERKEDIRTMNTEAGGGSGFGPGENATNQINRMNDRTGLTREVEVARQIPLTVDPAKIKSIKTPEDLVNRIEEIKDLSIKYSNELQRLNNLTTKQETHNFAMQHDIPAYSLGTEYPGGVGNYHANLLMNKDIAFDMRYVGDKKGFEFLKPFQFRTFDKSFTPWKATQEYTDEVLTKLWDAAKGHKERGLDAHQFQRLEDIRKQLQRKHNITKNTIRTSKLAAGAVTVSGLSKFVYDEVKYKPTTEECELNIRTANALVDMLKNNNTDTATLDQYIYFYTGEKLTGKSAKEAEKIKKEALDNAKEDLKYNQDVLKEREERHKRWEERQKKRRKKELKNTLKTSRKEGYEE